LHRIHELLVRGTTGGGIGSTLDHSKSRR
jgi:hypothetical protein